MNSSGWIQLALFVVALAAITKPMGLYLMRVLDSNGKTRLDPVLNLLSGLPIVCSAWTRARNTIGNNTHSPCC